LFELLTGQCPFEGDTITEVCGKVLVEAPPSLAAFANGAATELDTVIARCLEKDPNLRYQTVGELSHALRAWRPSEDVELPEPEPKPRRSARLPLAMVGLSALLVLGGVGLWQTHGSAASLEAQHVRPMIAAAASPIWRAFPEPPRVEPVPMATHARPKPQRFTYPSAFQTTVAQTTVAKERVPVARVELEPVATTPNEPLSEVPDPPAGVTADRAASDAPASSVDPVVGRYGL